MSRKPFSGFILKQVEARPLLSIFLAALALRWLLLVLGFQEFWGDAHHNLIMSKLTLDNQWVYTDFKDRQHTWLPFYRYWGSLVIWLTGSTSLWVMSIVNTVIGALTAVAGGWLAMQLVDRKAALWAGLGIALMPYLMVFSYVSMGEMQGGLFLLLWVIGVHKKQPWLIVLAAFCAALIRYELSFLMGISVVPLWWFNHRKQAYYTVGGLLLGLGIWCAWSYAQFGNPFNWLLMRIDSTTRSASFYSEDANIFFRFVFLPLTTIIQAFPLVVFFIWFKRTKGESRKEFSTLHLMGFLTFLHWVFFLLAQTKIMAYPDPRFFVISLPVTTVWFFVMLGQGYFRPFVRQRLVFLFLGITLLQLIVPFYRQYSLQPRKEAGYWMAENIEPGAKVWSDMAVTIVESGLDIHDFYSSETLIPKTEREHVDATARLIHRLDSLNIEYLTSYPAPFDYTSYLIPELNEFEPFEWNGLSFVPVFVYRPYQMETGSVHSYLRYRFEESTQPASVWRVYVP